MSGAPDETDMGGMSGMESPISAIETLAIIMHQRMTAYIGAGFTRDEAFALVHVQEEARIHWIYNSQDIE